MEIKRICLKNLNEDEKLDLLELMVYYKMSYPTGFHETCEVQLDDKRGFILTKDITYSVDDDAYLYLHLKSNQLIAAMYKTFNPTIDHEEQV